MCPLLITLPDLLTHSPMWPAYALCHVNAYAEELRLESEKECTAEDGQDTSGGVFAWDTTDMMAGDCRSAKDGAHADSSCLLLLL
jgi:hypothetical protein